VIGQLKRQSNENGRLKTWKKKRGDPNGDDERESVNDVQKRSS